MKRIDATMRQSPDQQTILGDSAFTEEDGQLPELRTMKTRKQEKNYIQVNKY